jgi:hypothetical protein
MTRWGIHEPIDGLAHDEKSRRGDLRIAHDHGKPMKGGLPQLIGISWATADRSPPLLETPGGGFGSMVAI